MASAETLVDRLMEATIVPSFSRIGIAARRRLYDDWTELDDLDMSGTTVVLTGGNSGLGYAAAERMADLGARLFLLVRSDEKGRTTLDRIRDATGSDRLDYAVADLADLDSVRRFADTVRDRLDRVDVLVHNAGAMFDERGETTDGIERTFQIHVVGPFLLTGLLMPLLRASAPSRMIWVSSGGMYAQGLNVDTVESPSDYRPSKAYARAKRAQVVLTDELADRLADSGVTFHAMHPGWAETPGVERSLPGFNTVMGPLLRTPEQGSDTTVWLAAAAEPDRHSGAFWLDRRPRSKHKVPATRTSRRQAERLWDKVVAQAGVDPTSP